MDTEKKVALSLSHCENSRFTDEMKMEVCPQIFVHGWWWRKFFPKERVKRELAQKVLEDTWLNGGFEHFLDIVNGDYFLLKEIAEEMRK